MVVILKIDAIVTSFNRMEYLHDVVKAISRFIPVQKIIIVDGSTYPHSKETARNVAKTFGAEFCDGPVDIGGKVYIGAGKASTEWILVCSDDTIVSRSYWPRVRELIHENAGFIAPNATHRFLSSWGKEYFYWFQDRPSVCAGSYVVRRQCVLECPQICRLNLSEDSFIRDYCVSKGYRFIPMSERVACHDPMTPSEILQKKRAWEYGRSYALLPLMGGLRMASKFALSKFRQTVGFAKDRGFSLRLVLFQIQLVVIMICGLMKILKPPLARYLEVEHKTDSG